MGVAAPAWMQEIQRELKDAFGSSRRSGIRFESNDADIPEVPAALAEPSDMQIIASPCHSYEPVKIPDDAAGPFHCLSCGEGSSLSDDLTYWGRSWANPFVGLEHCLARQ